MLKPWCSLTHLDGADVYISDTTDLYLYNVGVDVVNQYLNANIKIPA